MPSPLIVHIRPQIDDKARALCEEYWRRDAEFGLSWALTVPQLVDKFGVAQHLLSRIARENSYVFDESLTCLVCAAPHRSTSRTEYDRRRLAPPQPCENCTQAAQQIEQARVRAAEQRRRDVIRRIFEPKQQRALSVDELSLETAVYLLALHRGSSGESLDVAGPLAAVTSSVAPTERMLAAMISHLRELGIICVDPASSLDAFEWEGDTPVEFDPSRVSWRIAGTDAGQPVVTVLEERLRSQTSNPGWRAEVPQLWRVIVREEALAFLLVCLDDHHIGYAFRPGERTSMVLNAALESYSLARVWGIIWRAAKDAAAAQVRGTPVPRAGNSIIPRIQSYCERAVAEKWELKPLRRPWSAPQSTVSRVLFEALLRLPGYEDEPPSKLREYQVQ